VNLSDAKIDPEELEISTRDNHQGASGVGSFANHHQGLSLITWLF
jgi:hypothetical protein